MILPYVEISVVYQLTEWNIGESMKQGLIFWMSSQQSTIFKDNFIRLLYLIKFRDEITPRRIGER